MQFMSKRYAEVRPRLRRPISAEQLDAELAEVCRAAGVERYRWRFWAPLDAEHARNPRRYAQMFRTEDGGVVFEFAREIAHLPYPWRLGLYAHEVGHALCDGTETEDEADAAAERALGLKIVYDGRWPGKGLQRAVSA